MADNFAEAVVRKNAVGEISTGKVCSKVNFLSNPLHDVHKMLIIYLLIILIYICDLLQTFIFLDP